MLNLSPYHATSRQRRERLLNLATLRKPVADAEASEPTASAEPSQEAHAGAQAPDPTPSE